MSAEDVAAPMAVWRRCLANIGVALTMLVRPVRIDPKTPWLLPARELAIAAAAALLVFVVCMLVIDGPAAEAVRHLPRWLHSFFDAITDYGKSGWFLWPLGIFFLVLAALPPLASPVQQRVLAAIMVRVGFLFTAIAIPGLFDTVIKRLIGRARPFVGGHLDPTLFHLFVWRPDYASLPSGHATNVFAVLVAFSSLWPRTRTYFLVYALLILVSRVVVNAHYPTDVLAGAVVGTVGALMVRRWFAMRRLGFSYGPDGVPHLYPGPSAQRIKAVARAVLAD